MNIVWTLNFTGTADAEDLLAARHIIHQENLRRAALTPPGTPLPFSNGTELKASYLSVLLGIVTSAHLSYIQQARSAQGWTIRFTPEQLETIRTNLTARLNAGALAQDIVNDTAA